jgi:hypothetical protein
VQSASFQYLPDYRETVTAHRLVASSVLRPLDYLVRWAFVPYCAAAIVIGTLISGYIGDQWAGAHLVAMPILLFAAYYAWAKVLRNWCLGYFVRRLHRLEPMSTITLAADERGITFSDDLSSQWLDWRAVRAAQLINEGVFITFGARGLLVPNRAFPDSDERDRFLEFVNGSAKVGPRQSGSASAS